MTSPLITATTNYGGFAVIAQASSYPDVGETGFLCTVNLVGSTTAATASTPTTLANSVWACSNLTTIASGIVGTFKISAITPITIDPVF